MLRFFLETPKKWRRSKISAKILPPRFWSSGSAGADDLYNLSCRQCYTSSDVLLSVKMYCISPGCTCIVNFLALYRTLSSCRTALSFVSACYAYMSVGGLSLILLQQLILISQNVTLQELHNAQLRGWTRFLVYARNNVNNRGFLRNWIDFLSGMRRERYLQTSANVWCRFLYHWVECIGWVLHQSLADLRYVQI